MKKAIVYYSMSGNTEYVAKHIAEKVDVDLIKIEPKKQYPNKGFRKFFWGGKSALMGDKPKLQPYVFNADKYDRVIFAYPVWASSVTPPIRSFVSENKNELDGKEIGAIVTYMGSGAQKSIKKLEKLLEVEIKPQLILTDLDEKKEENEQLAADFIRKLSDD